MLWGGLRRVSADNDGGWFDVLRLIVLPGDISADRFCTSWSNLPEHYNDCPTAGFKPDAGIVELSFGSFKAKNIEAGYDYWGSWTFNNMKGSGSSTKVGLYGQEGVLAFDPFESPLCLGDKSIWCVFPLEGHEGSLVETNWIYGSDSYTTYSRR